MKKALYTLIAVLALTLAFGGCKKKEISVDKVRDIIEKSVIAEQLDSGRNLAVETITLTPADDALYRGQLEGYLDDSIAVTYDIVVKDEGSDLDIDWNRVK